MVKNLVKEKNTSKGLRHASLQTSQWHPCCVQVMVEAIFGVVRGLYTAPHTPAEFAGLRRTPQDSWSGLCWCDICQMYNMSPAGVCRSLPDS